MQIQSSRLQRIGFQNTSKASSQSSELNHAPADSVTFGSDRLKNSLIIVGSGFVPVLGAGTNMMSAWATAWDDASREKSGVRPGLGIGGALANVAGTVTGAYGLISGNSTATNVGLGLLGVSGLTSAAMVALTP